MNLDNRFLQAAITVVLIVAVLAWIFIASAAARLPKPRRRPQMAVAPKNKPTGMIRRELRRYRHAGLHRRIPRHPSVPAPIEEDRTR